METLILLKFFGIYFAVFGVAILANKNLFSSVIGGLEQNSAVAFLYAALPLMIGAFLVSGHCEFGTLQEKIVTVLSVLFLLAGTFRTIFFQHWVKKIVKMKEMFPWSVVGALMLLFGLFCFYLSK